MVDQARRKRGWNKDAQAWIDAANDLLRSTGGNVSRPTLQRFWAKKPIRQENFVAICKALKIDNWEAIVDDSSSKEKSSYPVGRMINRVINNYHYSGKYTQAIAWYQDLLADSQKTGDPKGQVACLTNLGYAYYSLGDYEQAINCYKKALVIAKKNSFVQGEGTVLGNMGVVFFALEEYKQAIEFYEKALDIWRQIGNQQSEALTLGNLEKAYRALGDYEKALEYNQQHLDIVKLPL